VTTSLRNQLENKIHHAWHIDDGIVIVFKMLSAFDDKYTQIYIKVTQIAPKKLISTCIMYIAH
jgi:hypothetical protein